MNEFALDWPSVVKLVNSEIERSSNSLHSPELTQDQTSLIRGEIRALKRLLALPQRKAQDAQRSTPLKGWPQ